MIRLIQRRLIIPRGDTGSFSIPTLKISTDNIAVFTIFDELTHTKMFQKTVSIEGDVITIAFTHSDTVNLKPGKYVWDVKYYSNPEYVDDELVNGEEIDSYYAGFSLPVCEIKETADDYLVSPDAPTATLSPQQLEIVTGAIHSLNEAIRKTQENVEHYPEIRNDTWYVWDSELNDYVSTHVRAKGTAGNGIASAVLNDDYTLTLNFTDDTSFTSPSIRGQRGNGIEDIVLNNDFSLTITYTDGDSYVTPSIRGPVGATPQMSIGTVQTLPAGSSATASMSGTAENPLLNLSIPKGDKGDTGEKGDKGDKGDTYVVTPENIEEISSRVVQSATIAQYTEGMAEQVEAAQQHAKDAGDSATAADSSKKAAAQSAQAASQSATAADTSARNAAQSETNAGNSAQAAAQSAQAASQSASNAATSEQNAADSAQDAQDVLDSIPEDYSTLSSDVTDLKRAVSGLESLDNAPAIINTASGSIASFDDGADDRPMKSLVAHIELVQDLHGYDSPWPAGGGKNLCKPESYLSGANMYFGGNSAETRVLTLSAGTYTFSVVPSDNASVALYFMDSKNAQTYASNPNGKAVTCTFAEETQVILKVYSSRFGSGMTIEKFQLESGSTATSWTPYSNICPITGWTGAKVTRTGVNLFDEINAVIYQRYFKPEYTGTSWGFDANSGSFAVPCKPNQTYTVSCDNTAITIFRVGYLSVSPDNLSASEKPDLYSVVKKTESGSITLTTGNDAKYLAIQINGSAIDARNNKVQIEVGSTATVYEPYSGETLDITFPSEAGTVYGGTLDVVSGVLTVNRASIDLGNLDWTYQNSRKCFNSNATFRRYKANGKCSTSIYKGVTNAVFANNTNLNNVITIGNVGFYVNSLLIRDLRYTDSTEFKTAVSGVVAYYEMYEPLTYQLTPQEVKTLLGQNNIWADTGDSDVTYQADTKLYIDNKFTELQAMILENIGG